MGIFKKRIKFVSAICPECKGHLELDSNLKTAFCQYCGAQCIVENAPKKKIFCPNQTKAKNNIIIFKRTDFGKQFSLKSKMLPERGHIKAIPKLL